jgi:hypothetical protein
MMYAVAVEDRGLSLVHRHVGFEPSGLAFNEVRETYRDICHVSCDGGALTIDGVVFSDPVRLALTTPASHTTLWSMLVLSPSVRSLGQGEL